MLTQEHLKEVLQYDLSTGIFTWAHPTSRRISVGDIAGSIKTSGHRQIQIDRSRYAAHRLAFLWVLGRWPNKEVDHVNGVKDDNRWSNLREATRQQNMRNRPMSSANSSGFKGVYRDPSSNKWVAAIGINKTPKYLGAYESKIDAAKAYDKAASDIFGEYAKTNQSMGLL
ncbi:HNH endonuclease [Thalassospira marina]|uniref:HNH endonuclease n=1 Tax=Thalassospira marina TaxID=2048283 RepID=UPI0013FE27A6|nr:HNH endonuclease [Thalassospira marina]